MKKILSLSIIWVLLGTISIVGATELRPSISAQIIKQEQINKKNNFSTRLQEQARLRQEAKDKILTLKYKQQVLKNKISNATTIVPQVSPTILTIQRPPQITKVTNITPIQTSNIPNPPNVDMSRVRSTWIGWYNNVRQWEWLGLYSYDERLNNTAYDWNIELAKWKWQNHHTRTPWDGYYNFAVIDQWFISRGIDPIVINRSKHTENVGYGSYSCNSGDCTDSLIQSIRSTFNFFMSEKWKSYDAHYQSIVQPNFTKIGLSVIVVPEENRYYLTVHYITR